MLNFPISQNAVDEWDAIITNFYKRQRDFKAISLNTIHSLKEIYSQIASSKSSLESMRVRIACIEEKIKKIQEKFPCIFALSQTATSMDQEEIFEEAKNLILQERVEEACLWIQEWKLSDQGLLFALAKLAAAKNAGVLSRYLRVYALNQEQAFEVIKIIVEKRPCSMKWMKRYAFHEEQRFEIAKIIAKRDGQLISKMIDEYRLSNQHRFEIAKIAIQQNSWETSQYIKLYALTDEQRFEVARKEGK